MLQSSLQSRPHPPRVRSTLWSLLHREAAALQMASCSLLTCLGRAQGTPPRRAQRSQLRSPRQHRLQRCWTVPGGTCSCGQTLRSTRLGLHQSHSQLAALAALQTAAAFSESGPPAATELSMQLSAALLWSLKAPELTCSGAAWATAVRPSCCAGALVSLQLALPLT